MGRRRRKSEPAVERGQRVSGYIAPASPTRPPAYHVYFDKDGKLLSLAFVQDAYASAAIKFAFTLCEDEPVWRKDHVGRITLQADGLSVRTTDGREELESLIELDSSHITDLPMEMTRQIERLILNRSMFRNEDGSDLELAKKPERKPKPASEPRAPKARKASPSGMKSAGDLAEELGVAPIKVRDWLRKNETKPAQGWLWDEAAYATIKAKVQKAGVK